MPNVIVEGSIIKDIEVKRILVKEITDAVEKAHGFPRQSYVVTIKENAPENVGVRGQLVVDRFRNK